MKKYLNSARIKWLDVLQRVVILCLRAQALCLTVERSFEIDIERQRRFPVSGSSTSNRSFRARDKTVKNSFFDKAPSSRFLLKLRALAESVVGVVPSPAG